MKSPKQEYEGMIERYQYEVKKQNNIINTISTLRLAAFFGGLGLGVYLYLQENILGAAAAGCAFVILFIILVLAHQHYIDSRKYIAALLEININSQKRLSGGWREFADTGEDFMDEGHSYSGDLDIFGKGSLFQWINTGVTFHGRQCLRNMLQSPPNSSDEIRARQQAVDELAQRIDVRQRIGAEGKVSGAAAMDTAQLLEWACDRDEFYCSDFARIVFRVLPAVTVLLFIMYFADFSIPVFMPGLLLSFQAILIAVKSRRRGNVLSTIYKYLKSIKAYSGMLSILEAGDFKSERIKSLKEKLKDHRGNSAYRQIKKLDDINTAIANRSYMFYIIFDIIFLLDYQFMISLECWRKHSGSHIGDWLEALGEMEALCSLALIRHDHADWCFPEICGGKLKYSAEGMGHPLMGDVCVKNSLHFIGGVNVLLITGSNMSGKSTLLRTAGINLVLAYCGAPVCAQKFLCSIMEIHTCMRIRDDLDRNISSFYAELLRIKEIVDAVKGERPVFLLLDEIFKGTNSIDRHTGAAILINQLSRGRVLGLVSTHDLELGALEDENAHVRNYHFQEHYSNDAIVFDYKLYPGVSTTRNAMHLMRLAGIDVGR